MKRFFSGRNARLPLSVALLAAVACLHFSRVDAVADGLIDFVAWLDIAKAGQTGDFIGGILNPLISLGALIWLIKGVTLQRAELSAGEADQRKQLRIAALSSLIDAHTSDIANRRDHLAFLMNQRIRATPSFIVSMRGKYMTQDECNDLVRDLNRGIEQRTGERLRFATELHLLLRATRTEEENRDIAALKYEQTVENEGTP